MARREKDVDMPRRGNFKGGYGQTSATGGAKKKAPVGMGAKPKTKPAKAAAKPKIGAGAKPKAKPAMPAKAEQKKKPIRARLTDASSPSRSTAGKVKQSKPQSRSGEMVLGGGPNTAQAAKFRKMEDRKRKR